MNDARIRSETSVQVLLADAGPEKLMSVGKLLLELHVNLPDLVAHLLADPPTNLAHPIGNIGHSRC